MNGLIIVVGFVVPVSGSCEKILAGIKKPKNMKAYIFEVGRKVPLLSSLYLLFGARHPMPSLSGLLPLL